MLNVAALALQCGLVDHGVLEAIVHVESEGNPYALAVNGDLELVREPRSRDDAVAMARWLEKHGHNFDAGLAQVNSANFARLGLDVETVFDPCANLRAASRVLGECYERALARLSEGEQAFTAALSCYNTGHFTRGVANGYVAAVRASTPARPLAVARGGTSSAAAKADQKAARRLVGGRVEQPQALGADGGFAWARWRVEAFARPLADAFGVAPATAPKPGTRVARASSDARGRRP